MIKQETLFALIIMFSCLINTTCKRNIFSKIKYEGIVYDSIGGKPSKHVLVRLSACVNKSAKSQCTTYEVGSCFTNPNGSFRIEAKEARSSRYSIHIIGSDVHTGLNLTKYDLTSGKYSSLYLKEK